MPLALLLQQVLDVFAQATDHLAGWARLLEVESLLVGRAGTALRALSPNSDRIGDWIELIRLEALIVRRAASAFLVHWFGTSFPMQGSALRIAIANLAALRARYSALESATNRPTPTGLDIGVPLASMMGTAFGSIVIDPVTLLVVAVADSVKVTVKLLFLLAFVVGAILPGLAPLVLLVSPLMLVAGPEAANEGYPLLLAIGSMLPALTDFMDALVANWESIIGPIVAIGGLFLSGPPSPPSLIDWMGTFEALVPLLDRVAVLLPLLLNGLVLLIFTLGPPMQAVAALLGPLVGFVDAAITAIRFMFSDFVTQLSAMFDKKTGVFGPLTKLLDGERRIFEVIGRQLATLLDPAIDLLKQMWNAIKSEFDRWWKEVKAAFEWLFTKHPTVAFINQLVSWITKAIELLGEAWQGIKIGIVVGSGGVSPALPPLLGKYLLKPSPASPPYFPDADEIFNRLAPPASFASLAFTPAAPGPPPEVPPELLRRRSVFARERLALRKQFGRSPEEQLAMLHTWENQLRTYLFDVVGKLLPPEARKSVEQLRPQLQKVDKTLRALEGDRRPANLPPLPVKVLPDATQVRPIIRRLRIHGTGLDKAALESWATTVRDALARQSYPAWVAVGA